MGRGRARYRCARQGAQRRARLRRGCDLRRGPPAAAPAAENPVGSPMTLHSPQYGVQRSMPFKDPTKRRKAARRYSARWRRKYPAKVRGHNAKWRSLPKNIEKHRMYMRTYNGSAAGRAARRRHAKTAKAKRTAKTYRKNNRQHFAVLQINQTARRKGYAQLDESTIRPPRKVKHCDYCEKKRKLCMDHCHITGRFRGWLCVPCNTAFGVLGDTAPTFKRALAYVRG